MGNGVRMALLPRAAMKDFYSLCVLCASVVNIQFNNIQEKNPWN